MNEEEKQAIEYLKHSIFEYEEIDTSVLENIDKNHKIIYKLILKQQKEIERLKEFEKYYENEKVVWQRKDYVSKDKIKEIKEKYKKERSNMTIIFCSKYGKTQRTFNQAVVNEIIKVLDEILGE